MAKKLLNNLTQAANPFVKNQEQPQPKPTLTAPATNLPTTNADKLNTTNSTTTTNRTFTNEDTGKSDVLVNHGTTQFLLPQKEVTQLQKQGSLDPVEAAKIAAANAQQVQDAQARQAEAIRQQQTAQLAQDLAPALQNVGNVPDTGYNPTITPFGVGDALRQNLPKMGTAAAGSAAGGAAAGIAGAGATASGIGTLAAGALATTAALSLVSTMKEERKLQTKTQAREFTDSLTRLKAVIQYAKTGGDPVEAANLYNWEVRNIYQAESNLKALSQVNWADAEPKLVDIESFRRIKWMLDQQLQNAILGNPGNYDFPIDINSLNVGDNQNG